MLCTQSSTYLPSIPGRVPLAAGCGFHKQNGAERSPSPPGQDVTLTARSGGQDVTLTARSGGQDITLTAGSGGQEVALTA